MSDKQMLSKENAHVCFRLLLVDIPGCHVVSSPQYCQKANLINKDNISSRASKHRSTAFQRKLFMRGRVWSWFHLHEELLGNTEQDLQIQLCYMWM